MSTDGAAAPAPDGGAHRDAFEILTNCHERIERRLEVLHSVGRELAESPAPRLTDQDMASLGDALTFLDMIVPIHTADEEQTLLPRLRRLPEFASARGSLMEGIERDHQCHGRQERRLRDAIVKRDADEAGQLAIAIANEYRDHFRKEEEVLFPLARRLLQDEQLVQEMTEEMRRRRVEAGLALP